MSADELRQHITAVPFTPFHLRAAGGRRVAVLSRDWVILPPPYGRVFVFQANGAFDILDLATLPGVESGPPAANAS